MRLRLPAVLEIQAGINHPRYASLKGIMAAKKKEIADACRAPTSAWPKGRPAPPARASRSLRWPSRGSGTGAQILEGDAASTAAQLVELLRNEARVL